MSRLAMMVRINLTEGGRTLLMQTAVMVGVIILTTFVASYAFFNEFYSDAGFYDGVSTKPYDPMWSLQTTNLIGLGFLFAALSAAQTGTVMSSKPRRLVNLMVPARQSEKYLARVAIYSLGFIIVFSTAFLLVDLGRVTAARLLYPGNEHIRWIAESIFHDFELTTFATWMLSVTLCLSVYNLGSFIWPRHPFVITSVAIGVCVLIIGLLTSIAVTAVFSSDYIYPRVEMFDTYAFWITVLSLLSLAFYALAYFRYRQDEVVNRW